MEKLVDYEKEGDKLFEEIIEILEEVPTSKKIEETEGIINNKINIAARPRNSTP